MAGAHFLRADLHVHTIPDGADEPRHDIAEYIKAALQADVRVLGITDHNDVPSVEAAIEASRGTDLLVLPGIEISTHQGHLLALFSPTAVDVLEEFASQSNLRFAEDRRDKSVRSPRSILDLVGDIYDRGGLAIPAHIDAADGIATALQRTELVELISHPGLAGLEFATVAALEDWFTMDDDDEARRDAWSARRADSALRARGLARVMSSDAHSPEKLGLDRPSRTLTRLRLDEPTFEAVRNALLFNPKARCKAEALLPINYPRILSAGFEGGFLDGVGIEFSDNLTCVIGGRGSGKSTALIALRAALGARLAEDEDPDDADRMPEVTTVTFIDRMGSVREVVRRRGETGREPSTDAEVTFALADLGQDESGRLARGYDDDPRSLLDFLEKFVDLGPEREREADLLAQLAENGGEVTQSATRQDQVDALDKERLALEASLKAAESGRIEEIAKWARLLSTHGPFLVALENAITQALNSGRIEADIDLDLLALASNVELDDALAKEFVEGDTGMRGALNVLKAEGQKIQQDTGARVAAAAQPALDLLTQWKKKRDEFQERLTAKQKELESQGLKVEAGEALRIANRLHTVRTELTKLRERQQRHQEAIKRREDLLDELAANREAIFEKRRATTRRLVEAANRTSDGLIIHAYFEFGGIRDDWVRWLTSSFRFRSPRVERLAAGLRPREMASLIYKGATALLAYRLDGDAFFDDGRVREWLPDLRKWDTIFWLQTLREEDRPRIEIQEPGTTHRRDFTQLSAGQQRSVLLSLILCADRHEPLVLDQPEDHLDGEYIATAVVRHLDEAKERRQVILATHSANLTVLGDAELVIPMYADGHHGEPRDQGAVDRPATRERVCQLLEGGIDAYRRRGERYGLRVERVAP